MARVTGAGDEQETAPGRGVGGSARRRSCRRILAGFEIDVLEVCEPSPVYGESDHALRVRGTALLRTTLLEHAVQRDSRTVVTSPPVRGRRRGQTLPPEVNEAGAEGLPCPIMAW
nr:hypothetical protein StreXyl84_01050 [Streptomyces sp. Xyl84]